MYNEVEDHVDDLEWKGSDVHRLVVVGRDELRCYVSITAGGVVKLSS